MYANQKLPDSNSAAVSPLRSIAPQPPTSAPPTRCRIKGKRRGLVHQISCAGHTQQNGRCVLGTKDGCSEWSRRRQQQVWWEGVARRGSSSVLIRLSWCCVLRVHPISRASASQTFSRSWHHAKVEGEH
eukprot:4482039-Pleurochrysis_carterae.AAC.3